MDLLDTYDGFFAESLQPILQQQFRGSSLGLNAAYTDSTSALVTSLLPMLRHKVSKCLPAISKQPQLLSHFIHELLSFDASLREEWGYNGGNSVEGWKGLTWEVLVEQVWFPRWLQVEKECKIISLLNNKHSNCCSCSSKIRSHYRTSRKS